jgi:hypothetical protein
MEWEGGGIWIGFRRDGRTHATRKSRRPPLDCDGRRRSERTNKPSSVSALACGGGSFLWGRRCRRPRAAYPGLGRGGPPLVPYLALLRVGFAVRPLSPGARCALTAPFHPCLCRSRGHRRFLSVALSVASRRPGVTRHPALRSSDFPPAVARRRSSLVPSRMGTRVRPRGIHRAIPFTRSLTVRERGA